MRTWVGSPAGSRGRGSGPGKGSEATFLAERLPVLFRVGACALLLAGLALLPGLADAIAQRPVVHRIAEGETLEIPASREAVRIPLSLAGSDAAGQLWLQRVAADEVWLERGSWRGTPQSFFRPDPDGAMFPTGFVLALPEGGNVDDVDLMIRAAAPVRVRPETRTPPEVARAQQRGGAVAGANYASLLVLSLVALALFAAVRDRVYLALLAFAASALAWLPAANGHLYVWPGVRWAALWGVHGVWALAALHCAAAVWLAQRYADLDVAAPRLDRACNVARYTALGVAAVALLRLDPLLPVLDWTVSILGAVALAAGIAGAFVAVRHRVWNSLSVFTMVLVLAGATALHAIAPFGLGGFWLRHGPQLALTVCVLLVTVGMIGRIAHVRDERDRERLARGDSERRLEREAARVELVQQLQRRLRELPPGDLEWAAFRSVFERLLPLLRLESAALVAYGFHGFDLLLAEPVSSKPHYTDLLSSRMGMMKGLSRTQAPMQLQLGNGEAENALHGVVPLPIRAPGWGVVLLKRRDGASFTDEELALAADFGRLAVQHADEAAAALNLRRSAELDALTGAFNRRTIDLWLSRSFAEAHREEQLLSVLFVDIDHFKSINDTHGHAAGDAVLKQVSEVLRRQLQPSDVLGRYGGEEFVVVLPGRNGDDARQLGERIRTAIEQLQPDYEGKAIPLTVSIGVATRLPRENEPAAAVARADQALYAAKRGGRNRVNVAPAVFS